MKKILKAIMEFGSELSGMIAAIRKVRLQFESIGDHMDSLGAGQPEVVEVEVEPIKPKALAKPKTGRGRAKTGRGRAKKA